MQKNRADWGVCVCCVCVRGREGGFEGAVSQGTICHIWGQFSLKLLVDNFGIAYNCTIYVNIIYKL